MWVRVVVVIMLDVTAVGMAVEATHATLTGKLMGLCPVGHRRSRGGRVPPAHAQGADWTKAA
jgi:hypothetical protein